MSSSSSSSDSGDDDSDDDLAAEASSSPSDYGNSRTSSSSSSSSSDEAWSDGEPVVPLRKRACIARRSGKPPRALATAVDVLDAARRAAEGAAGRADEVSEAVRREAFAAATEQPAGDVHDAGIVRDAAQRAAAAVADSDDIIVASTATYIAHHWSPTPTAPGDIATAMAAWRAAEPRAPAAAVDALDAARRAAEEAAQRGDEVSEADTSQDAAAMLVSVVTEREAAHALEREQHEREHMGALVQLAESRGRVQKLERFIAQGETLSASDCSTIVDAHAKGIFEAERDGDSADAAARVRFAHSVVTSVGNSILGCGRPGRYDQEQKQFYGLLLAYGGDLALKLVTKALGGPHHDTVKRWRKEAPRLRFGTTTSAIEHNLDIAVDLLTKLELLDGATFLLGEDGTSSKQRIDVQLEKDGCGGWVVRVYGLTCGVYDVFAVGADNAADGAGAGADDVARALQGLHDAVVKHGTATTFYVQMLIPLAGGAPAIPIVATCNANDFDAQEVKTVLFKVLRAAAKTPLKGRICGDVSDGDSRLRNLAKLFMYHEGLIATSYVDLGHPLIQIRLPYIEGHGFYAQIIDWLHIIWRWRTCFLKGELRIGNFSATPDTLRELEMTTALGLNRGDLNKHDKQRTDSCERLCGRRRNKQGVDILEQLANCADALPERLYLLAMRNYIEVFMDEDICLEERLERAGFVLGFLSGWKLMNEARHGENWAVSYLTMETHSDIVLSISTFVLLIKLFRVEKKQERYGFIYAGRLSSKYLEHLFAYCRSEHRNAASFGALAAHVHVNHYLHTLNLELDSSVELPVTRRQLKRGKARVERPTTEEQRRRREELGRLEDEQIDAALDRGVFKARAELLALHRANLDEAEEARDLLEDIKGVALLGRRPTVARAFFQQHAPPPPPRPGPPPDADDAHVLAETARLWTKSVAALKVLLQGKGYRVASTKADMIDEYLVREGLRVRDPRLRDTAAAALSVAQRPASKARTKKDANRSRFVEAVEAALDKVEDSTAQSAAFQAPQLAKAPKSAQDAYRLTLCFAEQLNASFVKQSRERAGPRSRFTGQDVLPNQAGSGGHLLPEHLLLRGRLFDDDGDTWRVVAIDDGHVDIDGNQLDGVFYDEEVKEVFVLYHLASCMNPEKSDLESERYSSLVATFELHPIEDPDDE